MFCWLGTSGYFFNSEQVKIGVYFVNFKQVKIDVTYHTIIVAINNNTNEIIIMITVKQ